MLILVFSVDVQHGSTNYLIQYIKKIRVGCHEQRSLLLKVTCDTIWVWREWILSCFALF